MTCNVTKMSITENTTRAVISISFQITLPTVRMAMCTSLDAGSRARREEPALPPRMTCGARPARKGRRSVQEPSYQPGATSLSRSFTSGAHCSVAIRSMAGRAAG